MQGFAILLLLAGSGIAFPSERTLFPGEVTLYNGEGIPLRAYILPIMVESSRIEEDPTGMHPDDSEIVPIMAESSRIEQDQTVDHPETPENVPAKVATSRNEDLQTGTVPELAQSVPAGLRRARRSQQPINLPQGGGQQGQNGNVGVDVQRTPGGTRVAVDAEHRVYRSHDGNTEVNAHGRYDRVYNGPGAGRPNYNAGVRFSHRW